MVINSVRLNSWLQNFPLFSPNLRQNLMSLLGLCMLVVLIGVTLGVFTFVSQTEHTAWQGRQAEAAENAAMHVALFIEGVTDDLFHFAILDRDYLETNSQLMQHLTEGHTSLPEVIHVDSRGQVLASLFQDEPILASLFTIPQSTWFRQAIAGKPYLGDVQVSSANEPYMIMAIPAPAGGVVAARVRMKLLWDVVAGLGFGETGHAYVVNRDGRVIAHTNPQVVLANTSIARRSEFLGLAQMPDNRWSGEYTNFAGTPVVGVATPLPDLDWVVITELSQSEAYATSRLAFFTLGGGILIFGFVVIWVTRRYLGRMIFQPMERLRDGAERIGHGNLNHQITVARQDEIGQVASAFNEMVTRLHERTTQLQQARDELEMRVAERTAELQQSNEQLQVELTERQRAEGQLVYNAFHDPLTDLPNRALFMDRLGRAIERAKRHPNYVFAVLFLDLDRFKVINDSLGHAIGDQLLIESARRLTQCIRTGDTVARLGGDEFVILLDEIIDNLDAMTIADRIQHTLAQPFELEPHRIFISVSIGIVQSATRYECAEDVLRDADVAMYRAKTLGRGRYEVFDTEMRARAMTRLELESDLRKALEQHEFFVYYQPIVSLVTNQIAGFEALVRWQHPDRGLVSPAEFIPMAEETGLIIPIGQWVLHEACRQMREWQIQFPQEPPVTISVNLSTKQFTQADLIEKITATLRETGLDARSLKLELTESLIVEDSQVVTGMLEQLRALGVQVQIDDFGTGYSSLGYLQRLPIDTLKIDRTFISKMGVNGNGSEIVRTILALAHDLGMQVIAEGVETADQLSKLKGMQCEYGQGYYFTKPVDSQSASLLMANLHLAK